MVAKKIKQSETFLRLLSEQDREELLQNATNREFKKGEQIVRVMDRDTNVYLINTGCVRVTLYSSEGKEVSFVDIDAGGNFGEFSAIDGKPRSANVIAMSDTNITIVPPVKFLRMLEKYPEVCIEMLQQLTGIVRRLCDRIFEYATLDVNARIHAELFRISKENLDFDGIARISNPPTQSALASRVSCTREAVSRELKKLEKSGVIRRERKRLIVEDYEKLQKMVDAILGNR